MVAAGVASRRWLLLGAIVAGVGPSCSGLGAREERTLRAALLDPLGTVDERGEELAAQMARGDRPGPGTRVAFVHHALRAGVAVDAPGLLAAEAAAFPGAGRFLARYAALMKVDLPPSPAFEAPSRVVLVLPAVDQTLQPAAVADLLSTLARPLRGSGAWVVPIEVGFDLVARLGGELVALGRGVPAPALVQRLGEALGLDACFAVQIVTWRVHMAFVVESVDHDVRYALLDATTGETRWRRTMAGTYVRREPLVTFSPFDDDPTYFYPSSHGPVFDDTFEFAGALNQAALVPLTAHR